MDAVFGGDEPAHFALAKAGERVGVLLHEGIQDIPADIAAIGCGSGVCGILLRRLGEVELAGIDLVQNLLGGRLVIGGEKDVARLLRTVVCRRIHLSVLKHVFIGRSGIRHDGLLQAGLERVHFKERAVFVLGRDADSLEGLVPRSGLVRVQRAVAIGIVVHLHGVELLVNGIFVHLDVVLLSCLTHELLAHVVIDDLFAKVFRGIAVVDHPLRPIGVFIERVEVAEVRDIG